MNQRFLRSTPKEFSEGTEFWVCLAYALIVAAAIYRHEPWADEAQSWLLARDSSLTELWTKLLRLEGSPGLWHSLLHLLIRLGMPYAGLNVLSGLLGLAGTVVLLYYAPLPLAIRIFLPFTYFLCFQYAVVARSYSLAPLLIFLLAAVFRARGYRIGTLAVLLILLAMVSAQAFLISIAIALTFGTQYRSRWNQLTTQVRRRALWAAGCYVAALFLITFAVWPGQDTVFTGTPNWSLTNLVGISRYAFQQAFGNEYWPLVFVALSLPLLWRGPGLLCFAMASLFLCIFGASIYSNVWHHGFLVLIWLFSLWISSNSKSPGRPALLALCIFIATQCSWTWQAIRYDWSKPYSGSQAMARYIEEKHLSGAKLFGIGYPTVALQPYFSSSLYSNYSSGSSFWLWSKRNQTNDFSERLGSESPNFVVLGYSGESDRKLYSDLIERSGYRSLVHFGGNLFWRTDAFQPENYELFRPVVKTTNSLLASDISLEDNKTDSQILWGFQEPVKDEGRWATASFGVALQRPPMLQVSSSGPKSTRLQIDFQIPDEQIRQTGPVLLTVYVSGRKLVPMLCRQTGHYHFVQYVLSSDLYWAIVPVAFEFRKSSFAVEGFGGARIAIVRRIALTAQ